MPNLIVIFGPPAVGKAAVGHELAALTGYRFFHNHLTADPAAALFGWGGEQFGRMVSSIRELLLNEAATDASIPGVIFTYVWDLESEDETSTMETYARLFQAHGGQTCFVELTASLQARIAREGTEFRVGLKPAQRNVAAARVRQVETDKRYRMNTEGRLPLKYRHITLNTEHYEPREAAHVILKTLELGSHHSDA
jgi:cytidylate kinase